jgi:hypothetical protein
MSTSGASRERHDRRGVEHGHASLALKPSPPVGQTAMPSNRTSPNRSISIGFASA